ncbi:hypothetical protein ACDI16_13285 [Oceanobacillus caeni]
MKRKHLWIIIFCLFLVIIFISVNKSSNENISIDLYDDLYAQLPDWSITEFPNSTSNYDGASYAWGWSYAGNSLVNMYRVTGEEKYLKIFVKQAKYIFSKTDDKLGIESFTGTGLSLPAWSDQGRYTSGNFNYIYPVHTGMITLPILRFIDTVYSEHLDQYKDIADEFLKATGKALEVHNQDNMWVDFSDTEGFYMGHPYGKGIVSEAGKIGILNRISVYLAATGLYDKLNDSNIYRSRIEKSLNYIKYSLLKYDERFDSYYWSYWEDQILEKNWEDISHATLTVNSIFILHEEVGFSVFNDEDFERFANNVYKIIDDQTSPIKMRKHIHKKDEEVQTYYTSDENPYYYDVFRWSFLGIYDKNILNELEKVSEEIDMNKMSPIDRISSIASFLYTKEKTKTFGF